MTLKNDAYDEAVRCGYKGNRSLWLAELAVKEQNSLWERFKRALAFHVVLLYTITGCSYMWLYALQSMYKEYTLHGGTITFEVLLPLIFCSYVQYFAVKHISDMRKFTK